MEYVDRCFKVGALIVSYIQYRLESSKEVKYCIYRKGLLEVEGAWLLYLVKIQVAKVIIFLIWSINVKIKLDSKKEKSS